MSKYDTIIIGAGMSGLAAGIRLAHFGRRVCILERHTAIGGLNSYYRLEGRNYDVGLHAVTNYTPKGARRGPLARLLRQLRIRWDDFALVPQLGSKIAFPGAALHFSNDLELLRSEVERTFPHEKDAFQRLVDSVVEYDDLSEQTAAVSARAVVAEIIHDKLLVEMLFCPLMYYGSAREHDMDFGQFSVMFRSIFLEGFARPWAGVRAILKQLVRKFKELGGELRLRAGVGSIELAGQRACGVVLDDGTQLEAERVLSSAGLVETMRLCGGAEQELALQAGSISFVEAISVLDRQPREMGCERTIVFFNDHEQFDYRRPEDLVDVRSGVICSPNNFAYDEPLAEGLVRTTAMANYDRWRALSPEDYCAAKRAWYERIVATAARHVGDFRPHTVATDMFTPTTIERFTGHANGAVYGAPHKRFDGTTPIGNLYLCGTDQGFVGIIGAMFSGIAMANRHLLPDAADATGPVASAELAAHDAS
ncbi:MAG: phytoene desaturase family protein [Pirellulales bacterium]